ncbi:PilN domain-containing protein [Pokkaliibacter sp. MBI-7]|uniref:PilN domain-containing protein n=1 Tax=Pokkaliibacter sp. MBI-7 TaxID=3040600 RepID=UPI0024493C6D|nr:PilN domain-containing protein [Pokkaliibacter sp. MBI-7]MDH2433006.1 PilN domain-containing protein [Pokkaliibacter sp. MBI-7]
MVKVIVSTYLAIKVTHHSNQLWRVTEDGERPWQPLPADQDHALVLQLTPAQVLVRELYLPLAAGKKLESVLHHELPRFTPFQPGQVYFAAARRGSDAQRLRVQLAVVRRDTLDALLEQLAAQGVVPDRVDALDASGQPLGVNLLPPARRRRRIHWPRLINLTLAIGSALLLATAAALWRSQNADTLQRMNAEVSQLQQQTRDIITLQQQLSERQQAAGYLARLKHSQPSMLTTLQALTDCLPADTWLEQLDIKAEGMLVMSGQSSAVSRLISRINACPGFSAPQFQGVIQPDSQTRQDRFTLQAILSASASASGQTEGSTP